MLDSLKRLLFSAVSLILEKDTNRLSIGRVSFIILLGVALVKWTTGTEIPSTMMTVLMTLMGYVFSTKVTNIVTEFIKKDRS